ncbi:MAG: hypothetical protein RLY86_2628 [Pseudomonadota bacterium]|jgi:transcriptional regulator PpsR
MHMAVTDASAPITEPHVREAAVTQFVAPESSLGTLTPQAAAALVVASGDVALVLDGSGIVLDVAFGNAELSQFWGSSWIGRALIDTVAVDSRNKVDLLLRDSTGDPVARWRHLNHPSGQDGTDIPIQYTAIRVAADGPIVAIGRDLRGIAALQQRLVAAQQAIERDYSRLRQMEMRYRLLFQATPDPVMIVEAASLKVVEANPAALALAGEKGDRFVGRSLLDLFDEPGAEAVQGLLAAVRATGRSDEAPARVPGSEHGFRVSASLFRQEGSSLFLVRLAEVEQGYPAGAKPRGELVHLMEHLPDAIVLTDSDGRIAESNAAFLDLSQLASVEQARGESLERWLGRPGVDLSVLVANLRQHGSVRLYATTLRGEYGATVDIEVSAVSLADAGSGGFGFSIRNVGRRLPAAEKKLPDLPRSVEQLKELVGRVPLKDLVRETTDVVEQLCIEAALELTGDNRASAAEILGLSRQSLYVKLRRFGLTDTETESEET